MRPFLCRVEQPPVAAHCKHRFFPHRGLHPCLPPPLHLLTVEDGIAVVTLNRPAALNSINKALRLGMTASV